MHVLLSPVVTDDFLIVILFILHIDKSLQMDFCRVYNLCALHSELVVKSVYVLEGQYLAIFTPGTYAVVPTLHRIRVSLATQGHPCILNTAMYPVEKTAWCVYALFIKDQVFINTHCVVDSYN